MTLLRNVAFIPTSLLGAAGYSFHQGIADDRPDLGSEAWWFCWAAQGTDIECGRGCLLFDEAVTEALMHWLQNTHPMHTEFVKMVSRMFPDQPGDEYTVTLEDGESAWVLAADARAVLERHKVVLNPKEPS